MTIKLISTGQSVQKRDIPLYAYQKYVNKPFLFLLGTVHGDEIEGDYLLNNFIKYVNDEKRRPKTNLLVLPCLNPDGKALGTRENANKIDLNRNYPTANFAKESYNPHTGIAKSGTPGSEPETKMILDVFEKYQIDRILSIHSDLNVVDYDGPAREWGAKVSELTGYPLVETIGYGTPGSFGTWAGVEQEFQVITLETNSARTPVKLKALQKRFIPLFESMLER